MGYYNLFYILRNIVFNFRKIFKYITISFLSILFIAICLLLISSNKVNAQTTIFQGVNGSAFSQADFNDINNSFNNLKGSYNSYICCLVPGSYSYLICFNYDSSNPVRARLSGEDPNDLFNIILSNDTYTWSMYELIGGGRGNLVYSNISNNLGLDYRFRFGFTNNLPWIASNIPIYNYSNNNFYWIPDDYNLSVPPIIENFEFTNVVDSMIAGEYFDIVVTANDYIHTPILFVMNNGTLAIDDDNKIKYILLDENSPYLLHMTELGESWQIPKSDLLPIYDNCIYNFWLNYGENFALSTETKSLTTSFSALGKDMAITDTQDATKDINDFLHNDSYDSNSITSKMPSNDVPDPTADQINNIFNMFRNFFSTENAQDVVFQVPHTNETITIPSNLVTSHIPQPILILIQSFYWFLICRFIVKDISKVVEHAKSGEILDATDGNIKTDLL